MSSFLVQDIMVLLVQYGSGANSRSQCGQVKETDGVRSLRTLIFILGEIGSRVALIDLRADVCLLLLSLS